MAEREFEVVVHGATGFTGTLVCEYLCKIEGLRWAISGRSQAKLEAIRDGLQDASSLPKVLVVSVTDKDTLEKMTGATKVVLSTAGPYARIGTPVVEACMTTKTDYCDITGEIAWVRKMMDRFGEEAKQKNILLVSCCGFDSAPSDLSTLYGVQKLREKYGAGTQVGKSTSYVVMHGGLSGGTLASGINMEKDPELARMTNDPFLLGGAPKGDVREGDKDVTTAKFEENIGAWTGPFGMAKINTRIVRRSSELLRYGPDFMYNEVQIAKSQKQAEQLARGGPPPEKREEMVKKGRLPAPGQGPSKELRAKSFFRLVNRVEAKDDANKAVYVKLAGGDPGYTETAKMVSEAALCLARKRAVLPQQGGYLTPATAMGSHLIESLVAAGISFEQVPPPSESATSKL